MTQFADQVRIRLVSQLINGISKFLPKLPKYFNGTAISTSTGTLSPVLYVNLNLNFNDLESVMLSSGFSLLYCHKRPDVF